MKPEEDDGIHVGDKIQHVYQQQETKKSGSGWLKAALVGASLLGGGGLAGLAASFLLNRVSSKVERPVEIDPQEYEFDFEILNGRLELGKPRPVSPGNGNS